MNTTAIAIGTDQARCPEHPERAAGHCGLCRSELIGRLDAADSLGKADRERLLADRRRQIATNRWRAMCDPEFADATMADVDNLVTDDRDVIHGWLTAWNRGIDPMPWISILGGVGTGKTHLAHALASAAVTGANPSECIVVTAPEMYRSLRPSAAYPGVALYQYQTTPLLVIDDLGVNKHTDWVEETTHDILNDRYRKGRPVIFTTNLGVDDLKIAIGGRMVSRLRQRCLRVVLEGDDRRQPPTLESLLQ